MFRSVQRVGVLVLLVTISSSGETPFAAQSPNDALSVTVRPKAPVLSAKDIPLEVVFQNNGDERISFLGPSLSSTAGIRHVPVGCRAS